MDIYGWMGSLAVYGFMTIYFLVAVALPFYLRRNAANPRGPDPLSRRCPGHGPRNGRNPLPAPTQLPYNFLPYMYLAYLILGLLWFTLAHRRRTRP